MSKHFITHVAEMPAEIQEIAEYCWDMSGRPYLDNAYQIAVGRLMHLCNDWDNFKQKYFVLFPEESITDSVLESKMSLMWHCYVSGMSRIAMELDKRNKTS